MQPKQRPVPRMMLLIPLLLFRQRAEQGDPSRLPGRQDGDEPPRDEDAQHEGRQCL